MKIEKETTTPEAVEQRWMVLSTPHQRVIAQAKSEGRKVEIQTNSTLFGNYLLSVELA